jgi:hypothetical protein
MVHSFFVEMGGYVTAEGREERNFDYQRRYTNGRT